MGKALYRVKLMVTGINKQVVWEKGKPDFSFLSVLPYPNGLNHRAEHFVIQISEQLAHYAFGPGTQVKHMPFLFS